MKRWVELTKGFSIAQIKETIIAVECLDHELEDAIQRMKDITKTPSSEDSPDKKTFGFNRQ